MSTKSITITSEAYSKLAAMKGPKDSFSDVINKITNKKSLFDLVGLLSDEEAKEMKKHVEELRKRAEEEMEERLKKLK